MTHGVRLRGTESVVPRRETGLVEEMGRGREKDGGREGGKRRRRGEGGMGRQSDRERRGRIERKERKRQTERAWEGADRERRGMIESCLKNNFSKPGMRLMK